jgi:hypothetical protein
MRRPLALLFGMTLFAARDFPPGGSLRFEFRDYLDDARYSWPRTLVSYPVNFDQGMIKPYALTLTRMDTGEKMPLQLSEVKAQYGYLRFAVVSFFADLPRGAQRVYEFGATSGGGEFPAGVRESKEGDTVVLDTGAARVRLPGSRDVGPDGPPPPVLEIALGGTTWTAAPVMKASRRILAVTSTRTESGPLFVTYQMQYRFEGGGRYTATVRAVAGYKSISLHEVLEGAVADVDRPPAELLDHSRAPVDLDVYKDWLLEYPEGRRRPPPATESGAIASADQLEAAVFGGGAPSRAWLKAYSRFYPQMTDRQKRRLTAWFLMMAYRDAPGFREAAAAQFPDHFMAASWATPAR